MDTGVFPGRYFAPELWYLIIGHLAGRIWDLRSCSLISRSASPAAQALLFRDIEFERPSSGTDDTDSEIDTKDYDDVAACRRLVDTLTNSPHLVSYIHRIVFRLNIEIVTLLSGVVFPKLREIGLLGGWLADIDDSVIKLTQIWTPFHVFVTIRAPISMHLASTIAQYMTLQRLHVRPSSLPTLGQFTALTHLEIQCMYLTDVFYTIDFFRGVKTDNKIQEILLRLESDIAPEVLSRDGIRRREEFDAGLVTLPFPALKRVEIREWIPEKDKPPVLSQDLLPKLNAAGLLFLTWYE
ncbi:hypothetical protein B0H10DRAFT_2230139 [Mycena sp. CBHHK59/15]|nr:hypothetical protein B0H10DRAFT_2230139 [Mycena sp. CBHHK59/15]